MENKTLRGARDLHIHMCLTTLALLLIDVIVMLNIVAIAVNMVE